MDTIEIQTNRPKAAPSWSTGDEIKAIDYMGSADPRPDTKVPTSGQRKEKIKTWLRLVNKRRWGNGVNLAKCTTHAERILRNI